MHKGTKVLLTLAVLAGATGFTLFTDPGHKLQFVVGGAMINAGYRLQDHHDEYDFQEGHDEHHITPDAIWQEMLEQNQMASAVRSTVPSTTLPGMRNRSEPSWSLRATASSTL